MTEFEAIEALSGIAATAVTFLTVFISLTFGYLMVAYFVGAELTRFQSLVISGLYILAASMFGGAAFLWTLAWDLLNAQESSVIDGIWFADLSWSTGVGIVVVLAALVSLYFMYDVRSSNQKPKLGSTT
jgi:hypothetical protein